MFSCTVDPILRDHPLYLRNHKSYVKTDTLPKGVFIRNPKKKTASKSDKNKLSMYKIVNLPFLDVLPQFMDTDRRSRSKPWKGTSACHKQPACQISWKKSKGFYTFPCLQEIDNGQTDAETDGQTEGQSDYYRAPASRCEA